MAWEEAAAKRAQEEAAATSEPTSEPEPRRTRRLPPSERRRRSQRTSERRRRSQRTSEQRELEAELMAERQALEEQHRERVAQQKQKYGARKAALRAAQASVRAHTVGHNPETPERQPPSGLCGLALRSVWGSAPLGQRRKASRENEASDPHSPSCIDRVSCPVVNEVNTSSIALATHDRS
jgi:hypothetical protein